MTEMTARVRNRLQDGVINWQERRFRRNDFRQQQADIHRSRMTCSASLPAFHQAQDWTGGLTASNRIPVIEETKPQTRLISSEGIRWDAAIAALVIIGGLKRISNFAQVIVPFMAVIYVFLGLSVLLMNATKIPAAFSIIFRNAFGWKAAAGGAAGWVFKQVTDSMRQGIARGIFSNEAGLGSAAIAASSAQVDEPVAQGLVSMTGTFIDTIIICTMTGLAIVIAFYTGEFAPMGVGELKGVAITSAAFSRVLGGDGQSVQFLLMICLIFFAFTTILGWDYYSERCIEYLTNGKMKIVKFYRALYIIAIAIGPYMTISAVWTIADITNGLMAIPNCISLIALSGVAAKITKEYFNKYPTLESEK